MDRTVKELRDERVVVNEKCKSIQRAAAADSDRELTVEESQNLGELCDYAENLQVDIDAAIASEAVARVDQLSDDLETPQARVTRSDVRIGRNLREDDPKLGFSNFGDFALRVSEASRSGRVADERLSAVQAITGMSTVVGADGGFLLPPEFSRAIWDGLNDLDDNLLQMTDRFTVTGSSLTFPANAETSRADGSRYGGVRAYWLAEGEEKTLSKPTLRQITIKPKKLAVLIRATDELLEDDTAISQWLTRAAVDEINFKTGDAIINGDGVGKPLGIMNSGSLVTVDKETAQAADTVEAENIVNMYSRLHSRRRQGAVWLINQDVEPQLNLMTIGVGTSGMPVYQPPGGLSQKPFATLMGLRVMPIEYANTVGSLGDIILADMKGYLSGTRGAGIRSDMSIHLRFDFDESTFRFIFSVDGQPWLNSALTPFKGSNTLSTFVTLEAR